MWSKVRREAIAALQSVLLPWLALPLPWPLAYRLLRRAARARWLFAADCANALAAARRHIDIADPDGWAWRYRTLRLVDYADFWLSRVRTHRWIARHVDRAGPFPALRSAVAISFHWGAGLWGLRALRADGHCSAFVGRPFDPAALGSHVANLVGRTRFAEVGRATGIPVIYPPGTLRRAGEVLAAGNWIVALPDVPPDDARAAGAVTLFGRPARFADGPIEIARRARVPVVIHRCGLDFDTGRRELDVWGPYDADDPALLQRVVDVWQQSLTGRSWCFGLWPLLHAHFADSGQTAGD